MSATLLTVDEVHQAVGPIRGYVNADAVAERLGVNVATLSSLPGSLHGSEGDLRVSRFSLRLIEVYGLASVHAIIAAGIVPSFSGKRLPSRDEINGIVARTGRGMRHTEFAKRIGAPTRMVLQQFGRGGLPGARRVNARVVMVPRRLLRIAEVYGLPAIERMGNAGLL